MNIIFLGAPGAGKGTQAAIVSEKLGIPTISAGNLLRAAAKAGTKAGLEAKSYMDTGALVPDGTVVAVLKERIAEPDCANGFILDGFPRNIAQAQVLEEMGVNIDLVLSIEVPDEEIMERMSGRRVCLKCGATFHVKNAPSAAGDKCDKCGEPLTIRADDKPETVADRLKVYHEQTESLKDFYGDKGVLALIHGSGIEGTTKLIMAAIEGSVQ